MPTDERDFAWPSLRTSVVLRVNEQACEVWLDGAARWIPFAAPFPTPRTERVAPGHLVALGTADGVSVVLWRWFDAVVLGTEPDGSVRLWEPAHGEVSARRRDPGRQFEPGTRAYLSAGLPGADWWVADSVPASPADADVELSEVRRLYTDNGLWAVAFPAGTQSAEET